MLNRSLDVYYFAGVHNVVWIQCALNRLHQIYRPVPVLHPQVLLLSHPNPVLPGARATGGDGPFNQTIVDAVHLGV